VVNFKEEIPSVIENIKTFLGIIPLPIIPLIESAMENVMESRRFPEPYLSELRGIADASGATLADIAMMNIYYELSRFCTSIVANSADGNVYHARNLDFGQLFIWDQFVSAWQLSDRLKKVTVNYRYIRSSQNNAVVFMGTTFAGHAGVITAMKPHKFTLSMNAKVKPDLSKVLQWLSGTEPGMHFAMWAEREVMEVADSYDEARQYLSNIPQLAGCYYIIGGPNPGEGVIMVRNETGVEMEHEIKDTPGNWFVLQTNYDPGKKTLYLDDRQTPGENCMNNMTQLGVGKEGLWRVLKSPPNLNKTTVHMVIMSLTLGIYETYIQWCDNPCWFL